MELALKCSFDNYLLRFHHDSAATAVVMGVEGVEVWLVGHIEIFKLKKITKYSPEQETLCIFCIKLREEGYNECLFSPGRILWMIT